MPSSTWGLTTCSELLTVNRHTASLNWHSYLASLEKQFGLIFLIAFAVRNQFPFGLFHGKHRLRIRIKIILFYHFIFQSSFLNKQKLLNKESLVYWWMQSNLLLKLYIALTYQIYLYIWIILSKHTPRWVRKKKQNDSDLQSQLCHLYSDLIVSVDMLMCCRRFFSYNSVVAWCCFKIFSNDKIYSTHLVKQTEIFVLIKINIITFPCATWHVECEFIFVERSKWDAAFKHLYTRIRHSVVMFWRLKNNRYLNFL